MVYIYGVPDKNNTDILLISVNIIWKFYEVSCLSACNQELLIHYILLDEACKSFDENAMAIYPNAMRQTETELYKCQNVIRLLWALSMHVHLIKASKQLQRLKFNSISCLSKGLLLALSLPLSLYLQIFPLHLLNFIIEFICRVHLSAPFLFNGQDHRDEVDAECLSHCPISTTWNEQAMWQQPGRQAGKRADTKTIHNSTDLLPGYNAIILILIVCSVFLVWSVVSYAIVSIDAI